MVDPVSSLRFQTHDLLAQSVDVAGRSLSLKEAGDLSSPSFRGRWTRLKVLLTRRIWPNSQPVTLSHDLKGRIQNFFQLEEGKGAEEKLADIREKLTVYRRIRKVIAEGDTSFSETSAQVKERQLEGIVLLKYLTNQEFLAGAGTFLKEPMTRFLEEKGWGPFEDLRGEFERFLVECVDRENGRGLGDWDPLKTLSAQKDVQFRADVDKVYAGSWSGEEEPLTRLDSLLLVELTDEPHRLEELALQSPLDVEAGALIHEKIEAKGFEDFQQGKSHHLIMGGNVYAGQAWERWRRGYQVTKDFDKVAPTIEDVFTPAMVERIPDVKLDKGMEVPLWGEETPRLQPDIPEFQDQEAQSEVVPLAESHYSDERQVVSANSQAFHLGKTMHNNDGYTVVGKENWCLGVVTDGASGGSSKMLEGYVRRRLKEEALAHGGDWATARDAANWLRQTLVAVEKEVREATEDSKFGSGGGSTCAVCLRLKAEEDKWCALTAVVGDADAIHVSGASQTLSPLSRRSPLPHKSFNDPGGAFIGGAKGETSGADCRDFSLAFSWLEKGDQIVLGSDGLFDQFEPLYLGVRPWATWIDLPLEQRQNLSYHPTESEEWLRVNNLSRDPEQAVRTGWQKPLREAYAHAAMEKIIRTQGTDGIFQHAKERAEPFLAFWKNNEEPWKGHHRNEKGVADSFGIPLEGATIYDPGVDRNTYFEGGDEVIKLTIKQDDCTQLTLGVPS